MRDFEGIKEQIRGRVDLVDVVSEHTALRPQGRNFIGLCPFHKEKTPSFSVNVERQFFKCFGCGAGGDIFTFVQLRESADFREALRILADRAGVELEPTRGVHQYESSRADVARANAWGLRFFCKNFSDKELGAEAREYVAARGITPEMSERFGIGLVRGGGNPLLRAAERTGIDPRLLVDAGLCRASDRGGYYDTFRDRLMFPIRDVTRRCVGFGGRTLVGERAKYLNTPENALFNKSKCLYGIDLARDAIEQTGFAIVVEGYTDCIVAHQHGFTNTVATLGTAATEDHMIQLRRYCREVVLVFDSDAAGAAAANRALGVALAQNLSVKLAHVPEGKDPADYLQDTGEQGFRKILNSAVESLVFRWEQTRRRFSGAESPAARREAVSEFVTLVADLCKFGVVDAIQQGVITGQLSNLLSVPAEEVRRLIARRIGTGKRPVADTTATSRRPDRPHDGEQATLVAMLTVLVNEPGLYERVADVFDPDRLEEPIYRRLAGYVRDVAGAPGEAGLAELLSRTEDPLEAEILTDLATSGLRDGNYAATLEGAAERLAQIDQARNTEQLTEELKRGAADGQPLDAAGIGDRLSTISRRLAGQSHFAHRRAVEQCRAAHVPAQGSEMAREGENV